MLSIPPKHSYEDTIARHFDLRGLFSVKSAYHSLEDKGERRECGNLSHQVQGELEETTNCGGSCGK